MSPWTERFLIAAAATATGVLGAWCTAVVHLQLKRWRNDRLIRRGEPPLKDILLQPMTVPGALLGLVVGLATGGWIGWWALAVAAAALPLMLLPPIIAGVLRQSARR